jgi:2,3-dihydro-2,3-dihydroxybenzoate dehydrogenase
MTDGIEGKVAIVTGAGGGIGAAVAATLAEWGAAVAAVDVAAAEVRLLAEKLVAQGHDVRAYPVDIRDTTAVDALVRRVERRMGPIGILVNVAGVLRTGPVTELTDEDWAAVFDVNAGGVLRCCRAVARVMLRRGSGTIVTVGSNAAGVPRVHMAAYAASKAATAHFMRCLGLELAPYGIRCNTVSPGSTDTAMQRLMWTDDHGAASVIRGSLEQFKVGIPLGRLARPQDIADAVAFLASERAHHITMQDIYVDGGAALHA